MQKKFQDLLHRYKVHIFRQEHDKQSVDQLTRECLHITEDVLTQKYHYHFHKLPDANRAEIVNMIQNYVREAILPPVIERIVERQVRLEHRFEALQSFQTELLEILGQDPSEKQPAGR